MTLHGDAWSDRVQEEKNVLDDRIIRLSNFFDTGVFENLNETQRHLLRSQYMIMKLYSNILEDRLDAN